MDLGNKNYNWISLSVAFIGFRIKAEPVLKFKEEVVGLNEGKENYLRKQKQQEEFGLDTERIQGQKKEKGKKPWEEAERA